MDTFRHLERHQVRISDDLNSPQLPPLNPSPGLGLPSQIQFIIGSSFRPEKFSTSALVPRVFHKVSSFFQPPRDMLPFISFQTTVDIFLGCRSFPTS